MAFRSNIDAAFGTRELVSGADFAFRLDATKALSASQIEMTLAGVAVPDGGKVWPVEMANTKIDRHGERFSKEFLDRIANQLNAESETFNLFHERMIPIGKVLPKAMVEPDGVDFVLKGFVWVNNKSKIPSQPDITVNESIETGTLKDVSVEVSGTVRYIEPPQQGGARGIWEWYVDPERPDATEISGLALVQKGAQRGSSITTKSIDGGTIQVETKIVNMFKDKYFIGGKEYAVTAKQEGSEIKPEGLETIVSDFREAVKASEAATAAKAAAETELAKLKAELDEARKGFETDLANFSKLNGKAEPTAEALKGMSIAQLKSATEAEKADYDGSKKREFTTTTDAVMPWEYKATN